MTSEFTIKYEDFSRKSFNESWVFKYILERVRNDIITTLKRLKPSPKAEINIALWVQSSRLESIRVLVNWVPVMFITGSLTHFTLRSSPEWNELDAEDIWDDEPDWNY